MQSSQRWNCYEAQIETNTTLEVKTEKLFIDAIEVVRTSALFLHKINKINIANEMEVRTLHGLAAVTGAWLGSKCNSWWSEDPEVEPRGAR